MFRKRHWQRPPLDERWDERELFFWTAFKCVQLIVAMTFAAYLIVSLVRGDDPLSPLLRLLS